MCTCAVFMCGCIFAPSPIAPTCKAFPDVLLNMQLANNLLYSQDTLKFWAWGRGVRAHPNRWCRRTCRIVLASMPRGGGRMHRMATWG